MSHVPYSTNAVNRQPNHVQTVNSQINPVLSVNSTTPPIHNVDTQPTHHTPVYNTAPHNAQTVHKDIRQQPPPLLHQHSTLTSLQHIPPSTMIEQTTDYNGTATTPADTCLMSDRTVHITPVNSTHIHTHTHHTQPPVHTTHEQTHSTTHNANDLNHLLTLHPPSNHPHRFPNHRS